MHELTKRLRILGLSHAEAAKLLGVHRTTIADKVRGDNKQTKDLLFLIAVYELMDSRQREQLEARVAELQAEFSGR